MSGAGNCVAEVAAVNFGEHNLMFFRKVEEESAEEFVGVGASEMDVATRVTALAFLDANLEIAEVLRRE